MVRKKTENKVIGHTRDGLNTKLYIIVDDLGNLMKFLLSDGNDHDYMHDVELLEKVKINRSNVLSDRGYGAERI